MELKCNRPINEPRVLSILSDLVSVHIVSLSAMKLMTGLVEVARAVSVQLYTAQRQYFVENSKSRCERAADRLEELKATISEVTHTAKFTP